MCGRYTQLRSWSELVELYRITGTPTPLNLAARYNIAPTQTVPIVRRGGDDDDPARRELAMVRWGLIPFWAKDASIATKTINARAETVAEKPAFRAAFRHRRCLIVADGFYEWQATGGRKQPHYITLGGDEVFAFAGLWERWGDSAGESIESCTIIVTVAAASLSAIHDRMPVILRAGAFEAWLDPNLPPERAKTMLVPFEGALTIRPVSTRVNAVRNDDADCLAPLTLPPSAAAGSPAGPRLL